MTTYPNSICDAHRNVTTSEPVCIICMSNEIESLRRDAERYRWLREFDVDSYLATGKRERLDAEIDAAMDGANA